jgi:hypothetical protein
METLRYAPLTSRAYQAGSTGALQPVDIIRGTKTHAFLIELDGSVTITGSSGGAVVAGGVRNLISRVRLLENGTPRIDIDGDTLSFLTSLAQMQAANIGTLSAATAATYTFHADFVIEFASVFGGQPSEIAFLERDSRFPTQLEYTFASDIQGTLISGTGLTVNSLTINTTQLHDQFSDVRPFYLPRIKRAPGGAIVGTQSQFPMFLYPESGNRLAYIIAHSVVDGATSDTVLNGQVTLRGDRDRYIDTIDRLTILNETRRERPGVVARLGNLWINLRKYGKLSEMWVSGQDQNLRLEVAATNPGTNARIDVFLGELEPVPGFTRDLPPGW